MEPDKPDRGHRSEPVGELVRIYRRDGIWYANFQAARRQHRVSLKTRSKKEAPCGTS
jgi:hypothetical protein